jgi:hypothetical protein
VRPTSLGRALAAVALIVVVAGCGGGGDAPSASAPDRDRIVSYDERLDLVEALGARYPGKVAPGAILAEDGLWAGIFVQSRWQRDSGRENVPLWNLLNASLTVEPSIYAAELEAAAPGADAEALCGSSAYVLAHPTPAVPGPSIDRTSQCEAWMRYFLGSRQGLPATTLQSLIWDAHTASLMHTARVDREALDRAGAGAPLEYNFWASWMEITILLDAIDFPTSGAETAPVARDLMPPCSPLGTPGCQLTVADLGPRLPFIAALAQRPASLDRVFALYDRRDLGPPAIALMAATDPSLVQALGEVLSTAGVAFPGVSFGLAGTP